MKELHELSKSKETPFTINNKMAESRNNLPSDEAELQYYVESYFTDLNGGKNDR